MKAQTRKAGKCGFCLVESPSQNDKAGGAEGQRRATGLIPGETVGAQTKERNGPTEFFIGEGAAICTRCVCFLQSLDNQTRGRDENRHKPYANIERVAYGIFRDPQDNGIAFKCNYCAKTTGRLVFVAPGQDICIECIDHFNSH